MASYGPPEPIKSLRGIGSLLYEPGRRICGGNR